MGARFRPDTPGVPSRREANAPMVKPELGTKRTCVSCGTRFYDLTKSPAVCPKCGTEQPVEQPRLRRASGNLADEKRVKKPLPVDDAEPDAVEEPEEAAEDEDDVIESTDDLDDDDEIGGDIEVEADRDPDES